MKSLTVRIILAGMMMLAFTARSTAQIKIDPALVTAIIAQTGTLSSELDRINVKQAAITAENMAIQLALDNIKGYEETMLDYLNKTHNFFQTAQQVINAVDKVSAIIGELNNCKNAVIDHPEGAMVSAMVSDRYNKVILEATSLVGNVTTLVKTGGNNKNLLNSAERLQILYNIDAQLSSILSSIRRLRWDILCLKWSHIPAMVNPELFYQLMSAEDVAYDRTLTLISIMEESLK